MTNPGFTRLSVVSVVAIHSVGKRMYGLHLALFCVERMSATFQLYHITHISLVQIVANYSGLLDDDHLHDANGDEHISCMTVAICSLIHIDFF